MKSFKKRLIYLKSHIKYFAAKFGLLSYVRENRRIIEQHNDYVKNFKKSLYEVSFLFNNVKIFSVFFTSYKNKKVKPIRILNVGLESNEPILLCAVKDDLEKIKAQVKHHRKMGIRHFAYVDNMSTDGTFEWLKAQNDVSLFSVDETFNAVVKSAWRRQVTDILGYDKWYLVLDSDELFAYPGLEGKQINEYINVLEQNEISCALAPMIDMYSSKRIFEKTDDKPFIDEYCWFDIDTYDIQLLNAFKCITGGPRFRVFSTKKNEFSCWLTKYPLIKLKESMILGTHHNYPYKLNFQTKGAIAFVLHYKFLPEDKKAYKKNVINGNYSDGSKEYNRYIEEYEKNPEISFYYEGSRKYSSSNELKYINIFDNEFHSILLKNGFIV